MHTDMKEAYANVVNAKLAELDAERRFTEDFGVDLDELRDSVEEDVYEMSKSRFDPADCPEEVWAEREQRWLDAPDDSDSWDTDDLNDLDPEQED